MDLIWMEIGVGISIGRLSEKSRLRNSAKLLFEVAPEVNNPHSTYPFTTTSLATKTSSCDLARHD
jgi:hypothetical protein